MSENRKLDFDEKTTIFDFFLEHNSLLIACVSGLVAIISFYISLLSYVSLRIRLNEYAILPELVMVNGQGNIFYRIIAAVIFYIALILTQYIIKYYIHKYYALLAGELYYLFYKDTFTKKSIKKEKWKIWRSTLLYISPYIIIFALICLLYNLANNDLSWTTLIFAIIMLLNIFTGAYLSERKNKKRYNEKTIKNRVERIKKGMDNIDEGHICEDDKLLIKDVKDITDALHKQKIITNESVIMSAVFIVIAMVCSFLSVVINSTLEVQYQKKYPIYYDNEKEYAIVFQNDNSYVLEEIKTNGDDLIIYRNKQRYLSSDDITVEYKKYKNIQKMDWVDEKTEMQEKNEQFPISEENAVIIPEDTQNDTD